VYHSDFGGKSMALHFVSTSVLSSTESGGYSEELKGDDESHLAQVNASKSAGKPLHEQLAEQAMRKQAEYDANTKLIFGLLLYLQNLTEMPHFPVIAPPKGLDEEDVAFYHNLQELKDRELNQRQKYVDQEVELFKQAQQHEHSVPSGVSLFQPRYEDQKKSGSKITKIGEVSLLSSFFFLDHLSHAQKL
jgi:hypothetical protein